MATQLSFQTFTSLVQNTVAAAQGACSSLLNLTVGSTLRAILEANASIALWLQWLLALLMNRQRLATCTGSDVDSFVNDFAMYRLPAVAATGNVTFSRFTSTQAATVPVGTSVITGDGSQSFAVVAVTTNAFWSATSNGYIIPAGTASAALPVQATTAGTGGNVQAGAISLLGTAIAGVDTVSNALALTGGVAAETDAAVIARFPAYIASLARATPTAVAAAIQAVQANLSYYIAENLLPNGTAQMGYFTVTIDDGSGAPSSALQTLVSAAVNAYRPVGTMFTVQGPTNVTAAVVFTLTVAAGIVKANVIGAVAAAVTAYVNGLPVGTNLAYTALVPVIYGALPAGQVINVTAYTINGATADIVAGTGGVVKTSSVVVN